MNNLPPNNQLLEVAQAAQELCKVLYIETPRSSAAAKNVAAAASDLNNALSRLDAGGHRGLLPIPQPHLGLHQPTGPAEPTGNPPSAVFAIMSAIEGPSVAVHRQAIAALEANVAGLLGVRNDLQAKVQRLEGAIRDHRSVKYDFADSTDNALYAALNSERSGPATP